LPDLASFAQILIDKGFNGSFQTQVAYAGKLKESITDYMEACNNGKERSDRDGNFLLSTYLQWSGDDKESIVCDFWVRKENQGFDLQKMEIRSKDRYGQLLKKNGTQKPFSKFNSDIKGSYCPDFSISSTKTFFSKKRI
jgi:hypothetical protein